MKNHAIRSPVVMGLAGALLGTVAARLIRGATARRREERIEWQPADHPGWAGAAEGAYEEYHAESPDAGERVRERAAGVASTVRERATDLKDRAAGVVDDVRERVGDARERAMHRVRDVRDRLPSTEQLRGSASDAYRFATEEQPVLGGVLAMAAGMALGFLLPVTEREERLVRPLKDRAVENLGQLDDKVRELADRLDEKIGGEKQQAQADQVARPEEESAPQNPFGAGRSKPPFPSA
jgi:hypothetical protein